MGFGENEIMGSGRKIVGLVLVFKEIESKFTFFSVIILFDEKEMGGSGFFSLLFHVVCCQPGTVCLVTDLL